MLGKVFRGKMLTRSGLVQDDGRLPGMPGGRLRPPDGPGAATCPGWSTPRSRSATPATWSSTWAATRTGWASPTPGCWRSPRTGSPSRTKHGRTATVQPVEFLHRLVQHVLPPGLPEDPPRRPLWVGPARRPPGAGQGPRRDLRTQKSLRPGAVGAGIQDLPGLRRHAPQDPPAGRHPGTPRRRTMLTVPTTPRPSSRPAVRAGRTGVCPAPGRPSDDAGSGGDISGPSGTMRPSGPVPSPVRPDLPIALSRRPPAAPGLFKTVNRVARHRADPAERSGSANPIY